MSRLANFGGKREQKHPTKEKRPNEFFLCLLLCFCTGTRKTSTETIFWSRSLFEVENYVTGELSASYPSHNHKPDDGMYNTHMGMPCSVRFSIANQANHTLESNSVSVCFTHAHQSCLVMAFSSHLSLPHLWVCLISIKHICRAISLKLPLSLTVDKPAFDETQ